MEVDINLIKPSPYQPRLFFDVDDLKEEIQRDGLLSALVVRKKDEYYELLDGERRLRTLKELGRKTVPVDVRNVDDLTAKRSVFKLNKIRENYTTEEEARYYEKLAGEGKTAWEISEELSVDFNWVLANLNVFKFPERIQKAVWDGKYLTVSHIRALENTIGRNPDEALVMTSEIINRNLSVADTRKIVSDRDKEADQQRLEEAKRALPTVTAKLESPEDYEMAAEALRKEAKKKAEEAMTPEEKAAREAEKQAKLQAQAAAKAQRDEEQRQQKAEQEQRRQERAEKQARAELKGDKTFIHDALKALPREDRLEILDMAPVPEKSNQPKGLSEQFQELIKEASQLVNKTERLMSDPGFQELDLGPLGLELHLLTDAFTELSAQIGGNDGEKKRHC